MIKDIIRLKWEGKLSHEQIAAALAVSKGVVAKYVGLASAAGLDWATVRAWDERQVLARLLPRSASVAPYVEPQWGRIHQELSRKGVTLLLLWEEYVAEHAEARTWRYTQFCEHYKAFTARLKRSMRQHRRAGEKMFIDFAGTVPLTDGSRGHVFVSALGASSYTFAGATEAERLEDWIESMARALSFYGGVPQLIVPDNPWALISEPDRYEPRAPARSRSTRRQPREAMPEMRCRIYAHARSRAVVRLLASVCWRTFLSASRCDDAEVSLGGLTKSRSILIAAAAVVLSIGAILLGLNLKGGEKTIEHTIGRLYDAEQRQFDRAMGVLLGPAIVEGNRFDVLLNGDEIFPAMLAAIRGAQSSITFESYIYWSGSIGQEFAAALSERAQAGVQVHVLLDWLGSNKLDPKQLETMKRAGVGVRRFHEPVWYHWHRMNNRTHRKVLVVDGKVGFTGGVGIADAWAGHAQDPDHWRDTHFRAEGPVVAQMQAVFMDNWIKVTGEVLHGVEYFPALTRSGEHAGQMFSSSPAGGSESMRLMYLLAITAAAKSIHLSSAYFVPDDLASKALVAAAKRGVRISIVTPGEHMDSETVQRASRARWGELLEAGIEIYQYQPTMYHCKVMIVDGLWVSMGSTNFDSRSFALNDEANLNVFSAAFAGRQIEIFQQDVAQSRAISLSEWQQRPFGEKLLDYLASLLRLQL